MNRVPTVRAEAWPRNHTMGLRFAMLAMTGVLALLCAFSASARAAEGERVLEPRMSLIGGCNEEALDPVEDAGCPNTPPAGAHPPSTFSNPAAVATDDFGNVYVSSFGSALSDGSTGRIDIFCSDGSFISELATVAPTSMAVDSENNLYVYRKTGSSAEHKVSLFVPNAGSRPEECEIEYGDAAPVTIKETGALFAGLAIDRDNDHLFVNYSLEVIEYGSAAEGNPIVRTTNASQSGGGVPMAVDAARDRMYTNRGSTEERIGIFDLNSVTSEDEYEEIGSIEPASVPAGDFGTMLSVAVDEGNGNVFVLDGENCILYEFEQDGTYLQTIPISFVQCNFGGEIAVDNGPTSPNGKLSEEAGEGRFLYIPSNRTGVGHSYAFFISTVGPPEVGSATAAKVSEDEVELQAQIDPNNLPTAYAFEYKVEGAASWTPAGGGTLPTGNSPVEVSAPVTGLSPGTSYDFRVVATNDEGSDEAEGSFATYPSVDTEPRACANALLRTGASALLPDCRAYELVTPAYTNGRVPLGIPYLQGSFTTRLVSPEGNKAPFWIEGGSLPGFDALGSEQGDPYLATRTSAGWSTAYTGPLPGEATGLVPNGISPDMGYSFYAAGGQGSAVLSKNTAYVRYPDGHTELLGQGSLGTIEPEAVGEWISEGGDHIVFTSGGRSSQAVQLEPEAAPDGTAALYDRTPDGSTRVVSLKPGGGSFGAGEKADFRGASFDGAGVAFEVGGTLYLRYDNEETFTVGAGVEFAGVAEGGRRVFYVQGGDLKAFDIEAGVVDFTTSGDVTPVTVAVDGTVAYFVSDTAIAGSGANPEGDSPQAGERNLYRSVEGQTDFIATVTERDVEGSSTGRRTDGLGLWLDALKTPLGELGLVSARSTPDGSAFLFKSRAALTDYDPEGTAQVYRYAAGELMCLSCNPTGMAAGSDADLQSEFQEGAKTLHTPIDWLRNLRADGRRAFFESSDALVASDTDGRRDVYEWEERGVGSCTRPGGCLYLVSSPHSARDEYLWAVSASGDDVFISSSELLLPADVDGTPSIYDARVEGGFPEPRVAAECLGEACQPSVSAPDDPTPGLQGTGNFKPKPKLRRCAKGKRKVRRHGKVRCVSRRHRCPAGKRRVRRGARRGKVRCVRKHRRHHHRTGAQRKGGHR